MSTKPISLIIFLLLSYFSFAQKEYAIINNHSWLFVNLENRMNIILHEIPYNQIKNFSNFIFLLKMNQTY